MLSTAFPALLRLVVSEGSMRLARVGVVIVTIPVVIIVHLLRISLRLMLGLFPVNPVQTLRLNLLVNESTS